jgi:hypothetical protein
LRLRTDRASGVSAPTLVTLGRKLPQLVEPDGITGIQAFLDDDIKVFEHVPNIVRRERGKLQDVAAYLVGIDEILGGLRFFEGSSPSSYAKLVKGAIARTQALLRDRTNQSSRQD